MRMKNATGRPAVAVAFALAFAAASLSRPPAASAVLAMPEADSYMTAGAPRTFGASKVLRLQGPPATRRVRNAFIRFDLSTLPPGTTGSQVTRAMLMVFVNALKVPGALDVRQVTSSWSEVTISGTNEPALGATVATVAVPARDQFVMIDVTALGWSSEYKTRLRATVSQPACFQDSSHIRSQW